MPNLNQQLDKLNVSNSVYQTTYSRLKVQSSEPLWMRVPTRAPSGKPYTDFMMLIPGLKNFNTLHLQNIVKNLGIALNQYERDIVLADLNLKINVLWVTLKPTLDLKPGLAIEIAALIHHLVPEAKLVSQHRVG